MARRKSRKRWSPPPPVVEKSKRIHPIWETGSLEELKRLVSLAARVHLEDCGEKNVYLRCSTRTETESSQVTAHIGTPNHNFSELVGVFLEHNVCFGQMPNGDPCFFVVTAAPSSFHEQIEASLILADWLDGRISSDEITRLLSG